MGWLLRARLLQILLHTHLSHTHASSMEKSCQDSNICPIFTFQKCTEDFLFLNNKNILKTNTRTSICRALAITHPKRKGSTTKQAWCSIHKQSHAYEKTNSTAFDYPSIIINTSVKISPKGHSYLSCSSPTFQKGKLCRRGLLVL